MVCAVCAVCAVCCVPSCDFVYLGLGVDWRAQRTVDNGSTIQVAEQ